MRIAQPTVVAAFEARRRAYVKWELAEHLRVVEDGRAGLHRDATDDQFAALWRDLVAWQAFRNSDNVMSRTEAREVLRNLPDNLHNLSLSQMGRGRYRNAVAAVVESVGRIKRDSSGTPSLVAVSKILHFWNPRLFVILDRTVMVDYVLAHSWLKRAISEDFVASTATYPDFLLWCSDLLRDNPHIMRIFGDSLREQARAQRVDLPPEAAMFEAVAVEWLLQGLVEIQPEGIT